MHVVEITLMYPRTMYPRSIDVKDLQGIEHSLEVKVLGTEETWNTPSLMIATNLKTAGVAVFSQVNILQFIYFSYVKSKATKFSIPILLTLFRFT